MSQPAPTREAQNQLLTPVSGDSMPPPTPASVGTRLVYGASKTLTSNKH